MSSRSVEFRYFFRLIRGRKAEREREGEREILCDQTCITAVPFHSLPAWAIYQWLGRNVAVVESDRMYFVESDLGDAIILQDHPELEKVDVYRTFLGRNKHLPAFPSNL